MTEWLASYHQRIQNECKISIDRRDRVTNLSYGVLIAIITAYIGFFADGSFIHPLGRFSLIAGGLFILIKFFFASMLAYAFFLKWRYLRTEIERYWMDGKPELDCIKRYIKEYDHGRARPQIDRNPLTGQLRSPLILILIVPLIPLGIEISLDCSNISYWLIIAGIISYFIIEILNFTTYDHTKTK